MDQLTPFGFEEK